MPRYKLTIAYDGTDFAGWQKQEPPDPAGREGEPGGPAPITTRKLEPGLVAGRPGRVALRTVQAVVERAVREVVRQPVLLQGASRTDAGVHARAQVAVFTCGGDETEPGEGPDGASGTDSRGAGGWPVSRGVDRLLRAMNSRLPHDVQVVRAEVVRPAFDPIGDCVAKGYSYAFWVGMHRPLWERRYVWHTWADLDLDAMRQAAATFVGEHDFAAFAAAGHGRQSTVREVFDCRVVEDAGRLRAAETESGDVQEGEWGGTEPSPQPSPAAGGRGGEGCGHRALAEPGRLVRVEISGNGFLYNMVRIIAGTLHEVGRGRIAADDVPGIIESLDRRRAGPTLPPEGLCLEWIRYREP